MIVFLNSAIVSGFSFQEVGDGESESACTAPGSGQGSGATGGVAADKTARGADSRPLVENGGQAGWQIWCDTHRSVVEA
tara:strand:- start:19 stop:255 length:237 start_codon:yes stop_codon:yes gene_type:complete